MTAPQPATPGSDSVRAQIAEVLGEHRRVKDYRCSCGWFDTAVPLSTTQPEHVADVLVPLVDRLRAEAKAEALEQAADGLSDWQFSATDPRDYLRARAAAYRTNPSSEETHRG